MFVLNYSTLTNLIAQVSFAGTAYGSYGSTNPLTSGIVDIYYNGTEAVASINGSGGYAASFTTAGSSREEVAIILASGGTGSAFYDLASPIYSGLNVYSGSVFVETDNVSLSSAVGIC